MFSSFKGTKHSNPGTICEGPIIYSNCSSLKVQHCASCVRTIANCKWCGDKCSSNCEENSVSTLLECPLNNCQASNCEECQQIRGCYWSGTSCLSKKRKYCYFSI